MRLGLIEQTVDWLASVWLARTTLIVADVWQWTPFLFIIFVAALQGQDQEVEEAARLDGASWGSIFWNISLPMMRPVIAVAVILRGIDITTMFTNVYIMTQGTPGGATETMSYFIYRTGLPHLQLRLCLGRLGGDAAPDDDRRATRGEAVVPLGEGLTWRRRRKSRGESLVLRYVDPRRLGAGLPGADPLVPLDRLPARAPRSSRRARSSGRPGRSTPGTRSGPTGRSPRSCATRLWRSRARS